MENQVALFNVLAAIAGVLIPIALYILWNKSKDKVQVVKDTKENLVNSQVPPGLCPRNETEGNFPDIADAGSFHQFLRKLHKDYGEIASFWWGPLQCISCYKPEHFKQTAKIFDRPRELFTLFTPAFGQRALQIVNGVEGQTRHKAYSRCYSEKTVLNYYNTWNKTSHQLVSDLLLKTQPEQHVTLKETTFSMSIKSILHLSYGELFTDNKQAISLMNSYEFIWDDMESRLKGNFPEGDEARQRLFDEHINNMKTLFLRAITSNQSSPEDKGDNFFLDVLAEVNDGDDEIMICDAIMMFIAAVHTTGLLLDWTLYYLAEDQSVQDRLRSEIQEVMADSNQVEHHHVQQMSYLRQVVNESLRCSILAPYAARVFDHEVTLGQYVIPEKTPMVHALGVSLENEEIWPNHEQFNPDRFSPENARKIPSFGFEPFGCGKRRCLGSNFGLLESSIFLVEMLKHFKVYTVPGQQIDKVHGLVTKPSKDIWYTLEKVQM